MNGSRFVKAYPQKSIKFDLCLPIHGLRKNPGIFGIVIELTKMETVMKKVYIKEKHFSAW